MYELIQLTERTYYIKSPTNIGLFRLDEKNVCLIDSGNDKDAGRRIRQVLDANGWQLTAIYNTHANADHIGGNRYLQGQTGCRIYAPGIDCAFTRHPVLEPSFLYGGYPPKDLRHKFLLAQESDAAELTADVVFLADCLSSREILDKYQIGFIYDVAGYLKTLEQVQTMTAKVFVPAHTEVTEDIVDLAQYNIRKVHEIAERIVDLCAAPRGFEDILQQLFAAYGLTMSFEQYVLVGSTVRSYLAWLKDTGRLTALFEDGWMRWARV